MAGTSNAAFAFGVNDRNEENPNKNFVGLKIFNSYGARDIYLVGNVKIFTDSINENAQGTSLKDIFYYINQNFKKLQEFRDRNGEGYPGFYDIEL